MVFFHWNLDTDTKYSANRTVQQMVLLLGICIWYFQVLWNRTGGGDEDDASVADRLRPVSTGGGYVAAGPPLLWPHKAQLRSGSWLACAAELRSLSSSEVASSFA